MAGGAAEGLHGRCGGTTRVAAEGDEVVAAERRHDTGAAEGDATKWWQRGGYSPGVAAGGRGCRCGSHGGGGDAVMAAKGAVMQR